MPTVEALSPPCSVFQLYHVLFYTKAVLFLLLVIDLLEFFQQWE